MLKEEKSFKKKKLLTVSNVKNTIKINLLDLLKMKPLKDFVKEIFFVFEELNVIFCLDHVSGVLGKE